MSDIEITKSDLENKPNGYWLCFSDKCKLAEKCLRHLVGERNDNKSELLRIVNHRMFDETNCKYHVEIRKADIAYGMMKALNEVKACDIVNIKKILISKFGRKYFYSRRNGVTPIPPSEQKYIRKVFAKFGYEITFDEIREETLWK